VRVSGALIFCEPFQPIRRIGYVAVAQRVFRMNVPDRQVVHGARLGSTGPTRKRGRFHVEKAADILEHEAVGP